MDKRTLKENFPQFKKVFFILCTIYILSFSAILRANFLYMDDLGRNLLGYRDFSYLGRYTALYGCTVLHTDTYLMDISPLPQLVAAVILALSSTILLFVFSGEDQKITFWQIFAVLPLGLSPTFWSVFPTNLMHLTWRYPFSAWFSPCCLRKKAGSSICLPFSSGHCSCAPPTRPILASFQWL